MKNGDRPAFPEWDLNEKGLTKREYFAAKAMQGILSNQANSHLDLMGVNTSGPLGFIAANFAAKEAVQYADELLKQLES